jgi:SAM-dependent methyltransferase
VATDIDPRFLAAPELAGVEVRRHDIRRDLLETGHYDLVHCRALLMHLAEPERALARMAAALRPGGWLLVEEGDLETFAVADPAHAASAMVNHVHRLATVAMQARGRIALEGRQAFGLGLAEAGFKGRRHAGEAELAERAVEFGERHSGTFGSVWRSMRSR